MTNILKQYRYDDSGRSSKAIKELLNMLPFRKLAGKTQVILSLKGPDVRTRLTHTVEVARGARDISEKLGLNADLAEAIALAHDIGHTPFGHVGERTLKEIMNQCDTLNGKIENDSSDNFTNHGFKHNLQSLKLLHENDVLKQSPCILWGVPNHSKLTWAQIGQNDDNDIYITNKQCKHVFNCYYSDIEDNKRICKFNKKEQRKANHNGDNLICKPWYCAYIDNVKTEKHSTGTPWEHTKCFSKCYFANLWKYKLKKEEEYTEFNFLFDHPFPNSYYGPYLLKLIKKNSGKFKPSNENSWSDLLSFESYTVEQADDIAQRQQDLEDGQKINLLPKDKNKIKKKLDEIFKEIKKTEIPGWDKSRREKEVEDEKMFFDKSWEKSPENKDSGLRIHDFLMEILLKDIEKHVNEFVHKRDDFEINYFCLLDILNRINGKNYKWIHEEKEISIETREKSIEKLKELFADRIKINENPNYFPYIICTYFDDFFKGKISKSVFNNELDLKKERTRFKSDNLCNIFKYYINETLKINGVDDELKNKISGIKQDIEKNNCWKNDCKVDCHANVFGLIYEIYDKVYNNKKMLKKEHKYYSSKTATDEPENPWTTLEGLNLPEFSYLYTFLQNFNSNAPITSSTISKINKTKILKIQNAFKRNNFHEDFIVWKDKLGLVAHRKLANIIYFAPVGREFNNKLKDYLMSTVLNSEIVEKIDGKANYIIKRLFKAYITNPHQLPDDSLKQMLKIIKEDKKNILKLVKKKVAAIKKGFEILGKVSNPEIKEIKEIKVLTEDHENIKATLEQFVKPMGSPPRDKENESESLRKLRTLLNNSILLALPYFNALICRTICDYIGAMTDSEALMEYDKLYAGIMEIV